RLSGALSLMAFYLFNSLSARMSSLEVRILSLETSSNQRFDILIGKVSETDTRLSILEGRSDRA
ncbi:MAG: hypothetical protein WBY44_26225, partial [Bryobacteraceae bacterium]